MNFKKFILGVAVTAMAAGAVTYATGHSEQEARAPQHAVATNSIPGTLPLGDWKYVNCKAENNNTNVGYVESAKINTATIDVTCTETGVYAIDWEWKLYGGGLVLIEVTDLTTSEKEISQYWDIEGGKSTLRLEGLITQGTKNIKFTITTGPTSVSGQKYIANYYTPTFKKVADTYSPVPEGWDVIPGALDLAKWKYVNCRAEPTDAEEKTKVGCNVNGSSASVDFYCEESAYYIMDWTWSYATTGEVKIVVKDLKTDNIEVDQTWSIADGHQPVKLNAPITKGRKNLSLSLTSSGTDYLGNYTTPIFTKDPDAPEVVEVPEGWDVIPGSLDLTHWSYVGGLRTENEGTNVGCVKAGNYATHQFYCKEEGVYRLDINFPWFQNEADFVVTVTDQETKKKEVVETYHVSGKHEAHIPLLGLITKGKKDIRFDIVSGKSGWIFNWNIPTFTKIGNSFAMVKDVTVDDSSILAGEQEGYDYAFTLPIDYTSDNVVFTADVVGATATVTASGETTVTDLGEGKYSIPTPALNSETIVTIALEAEEGAYKGKEQYLVRFFRLGDVKLTGLSIDSFNADAETIAALNESNTANVGNYVFTAVPKVTATFADGSTATATSTVEGTTATYTFTGKAGDKVKNFTLTVDGIHLFIPGEGDNSVTVKYDSANNQSDNSWSDGVHTVYPANDGWGGKQFKFKGGTITFSTLPDRKVKQLVLAQLFDNYVDGRIKSVTSEGATIWLPSASDFKAGGPGYDLVINVENHVPGTPFVIEYENGSQPVWWFEYVYETVVPTDAPSMTKVSCTDLTGKNHAVISFTFNREIKDVDVEFNGKTVNGYAIGTVLSFPIWDLEYAKEYTFTIPAGKVSDNYGNVTDTDITYTFTTGEENYVETLESERFITVSTVEELRAAVANLSQTNKNADSPTTIIYMHDGEYDLGTDAETAHIDINKVYNVSLVGQSEEGVLIHGTRDGISYPILSTRYSTNIYMENFTVRNDYDFLKERKGVAVAHVGGNLDIMKNVTLQSTQDTQVTGERGYYHNVTIYGLADYICGGGDHFYDQCTLVNTGEGGYITAPSTSPAQKYGYVFSNCKIQGDGNYYLGRPWANEPRCYWINTTMVSLPKTDGWAGMSNLTTHFYEYNSKDANGNVLDLSGRKNSPTSTNSYTPILTKEEAEQFTIHNVLGYADSWDPTELTAQCEAPTVTLTSNGLRWNAIANAAGYVIYVNSHATHFTTATEFTFPEAPAAVMAREEAATEYKVAALSSNGSHGVLSAAAKADTSTGIDAIGADAAAPVEYYNLQGIRVDNPAAGVFIRRQGSSVTKIVIN